MSASRPIIRDSRELSIVASVGQTSFAWAKPLFDALDLEVAVSVNAAAFVVQTSGVTVTPAADRASAEVVFAVAPRTSGGQTVVVRLRGRRVHERVANVTRGAAISSSAIEDELDRQTVALQDLQAQTQRLLDTQVAIPFDRAGPLAGRAAFNTEAAGFVYLQTDEANGRPVYFVKLSATSGDWSQGLTPKGVDGVNGAPGSNGTNGISAITPALATGTADAIVAAFTPAQTTLAGRSSMQVRAIAANSGAATFNAGFGVRDLVKGAGLPLEQGDIPGAGFVMHIDADPEGNRFVLANPARGIAAPRSGVRQTAQSGPANAAGAPSFMPASSGSLALTSAGLAPASPLIVCAALGHDARGAVDRFGIASANLTWSGLANNATVFGGVTVNTDGSLTPFSTTLAPNYTFANAPSTAAGQYTFVIPLMQMFLGNGSTANAVAAVFLWEAVTAAGAVTSVTPYAYNGVFEETGAAALTLTPSVNHNLGVGAGVICQFAVVCATAEAGYAIGDVLLNVGTTTSTQIESLPWALTRTRAALRAGNHGSAFYRGVNAATGASFVLSLANWRHRFTVRRAW